MMMKNEKFATILLILGFVGGMAYGNEEDSKLVKSKLVDAKMDLETAATGANLFDLSSLLLRPTYGGYPSTGVGGGYYPTNNFYPSSGFRPNYYPNSGGYNPSTYPNYPNQGYPGVSGFGGYYPQSTGTNILGGGYNNGYGGYGGYGGNGGFHSYSGYLDNDYNGHRNLGYGYYRGTDRFGFYRPAQPSLHVSGYRGYE